MESHEETKVAAEREGPLPEGKPAVDRVEWAQRGASISLQRAIKMYPVTEKDLEGLVCRSRGFKNGEVMHFFLVGDVVRRAAEVNGPVWASLHQFEAKELTLAREIRGLGKLLRQERGEMDGHHHDVVRLRHSIEKHDFELKCLRRERHDLRGRIRLYAQSFKTVREGGLPLPAVAAEIKGQGKPEGQAAGRAVTPSA